MENFFRTRLGRGTRNVDAGGGAGQARCGTAPEILARRAVRRKRPEEWNANPANFRSGALRLIGEAQAGNFSR